MMMIVFIHCCLQKQYNSVYQISSQKVNKHKTSADKYNGGVACVAAATAAHFTGDANGAPSYS